MVHRQDISFGIISTVVVILVFVSFAVLGASELGDEEKDKNVTHFSFVSEMGATQRVGLLLTAYKDRLKDYKEDVKVLAGNFIFQLSLIVIAFVAVTGTNKQIEVPVIKLSVPVSWLYSIVPIGLLYFWLLSGFTIDKLIESRSDAWAILQEVSPNTTISDDLFLLSYARLFEDGSFVDGWFLNFRSSETVIDSESQLLSGGFFMLVYGLLLGFSHACIVTLPYFGAKYFIQRATKRVEVIFYSVLTFGLLIASHFQFRFGGDNEANYLQHSIGVFTIVGVWILLAFNKKKTEEKVQAEIQKNECDVNSVIDPEESN